jgi:succinyl-CoA synthetase beta subunit
LAVSKGGFFYGKTSEYKARNGLGKAGIPFPEDARGLSEELMPVAKELGRPVSIKGRFRRETRQKGNCQHVKNPEEAKEAAEIILSKTVKGCRYEKYCEENLILRRVIFLL